MRCLHAIFTLLPEALKRSKMKKMAKAKRLPVCCEFHSSARGATKKRGRTPDERQGGAPGADCSAETRFAEAAGEREPVSRRPFAESSELVADVHFVVGPSDRARRVPAHKRILAVESRVFDAMFFGDASTDQVEFHIPDVEPASFLSMIRCIYCEEAPLEVDTALSTLRAAKRFAVARLARTCRAFLEGSLSHDNACALLAQSLALHEQGLAERCWELIDAQAELALGSRSFLQLDRATVESILRRESLTAREASVFEAALAWSGAECQRQGLEPTAKNKRKALGSALHLVRIPAMSVEEFANGAAQSGVLSAEETNSIFLFYTARQKPRLDFLCVPRKGLATSRCLRFQSSCSHGGGIGGIGGGADQRRCRSGGGRCDAVLFKVDRRIFLTGLGLYGPRSGAAECAATVDIKRRGATLARLSAPLLSSGDSARAVPVWFEHPVQVEPHVFHTASAVLAGAEVGYSGEDGLAEVRCDGVAFLFQCAPESDAGTGVLSGQIPELMFYA
ncbi:BTB/POZ domain-containing protein 6-B-like isoform X1 [Lethenteron reissneri]|uniref:BTB/POZ domain-containing protein 6-B-like isoform X1 n=1 Tax=Lethenteron reissneri TaxID=7753 RepID=UPI002AB7855D|nr:BTB/POZ domain-containing protein 6-B-like isoform X1 [Lethenteron reissneri]